MRSSTLPSWAAGRPGSQPRCARHRKACRRSFSTAGRSAARRMPAPASKITWAFRPASPVRRSPAAPSCRHKGIVKLFGDLMISATQSPTDGVAVFLRAIQLAVTKLFVSTTSFHCAKRRRISARQFDADNVCRPGRNWLHAALNVEQNRCTCLRLLNRCIRRSRSRVG